MAIGRNYALHIKELGNATPKEPFFFLKPTTSYAFNRGKIEIPQGIDAHYEGMYVAEVLGHTANVGHLVELGVVIGQRGRDIDQKSALSYVSGYGEGGFLGL